MLLISILSYVLFIRVSKADYSFSDIDQLESDLYSMQSLPPGCELPPLHRAVAAGELGSVLYILSDGSDIYSTDCGGMSPMHVAVRKRNYDIIHALLEKNFNLNREFDSIETVLIFAIQNSLETERLLIELGAKVNMIFEPTGETYLHKAVAAGDFLLTKNLIKLGADIDATDWSKNTPLTISIKKNKVAILNLLTAAGGDVKKGNLVHLAVKSNSTDCLKVLLGMGLAVDAKDEEGYTPIVLALKDDSDDMIRILIAFKADLSQTRNGENLLFRAVRYSSNKSLRVLLDKGLLDHADGNGLMRSAIHRGNINALEILAEFGQDLTATDSLGFNALHYAAELDRPVLIRWLVAHHVDVNSTGDNQWTPLHLAVNGNHLEAVRTLVQSGACITCKIRTWPTPLELAKNKNYIEIIDYLQAQELEVESDYTNVFI